MEECKRIDAGGVAPRCCRYEIQLTDAIASLMNQEQVDAFYMTEKSCDCGSKLGYMKAFVEYGLKHCTEGDKLKTG